MLERTGSIVTKGRIPVDYLLEVGMYVGVWRYSLGDPRILDATLSILAKNAAWIRIAETEFSVREGLGIRYRVKLEFELRDQSLRKFFNHKNTINVHRASLMFAEEPTEELEWE